MINLWPIHAALPNRKANRFPQFCIWSRVNRLPSIQKNLILPNFWYVFLRNNPAFPQYIDRTHFRTAVTFAAEKRPCVNAYINRLHILFGLLYDFIHYYNLVSFFCKGKFRLEGLLSNSTLQNVTKTTNQVLVDARSHDLAFH